MSAPKPWERAKSTLTTSQSPEQIIAPSTSQTAPTSLLQQSATGAILGGGGIGGAGSISEEAKQLAGVMESTLGAGTANNAMTSAANGLTTTNATGSPTTGLLGGLGSSSYSSPYGGGYGSSMYGGGGMYGRPYGMMGGGMYGGMGGMYGGMGGMYGNQGNMQNRPLLERMSMYVYQLCEIA